MIGSRLMLSILALVGTAWVSGCGGAEVSAAAGDKAISQDLDLYEAAPYLGELTNRILYNDIWERPQLSKRDRSVITLAILQALYRDELEGHIDRALDNGLTQAEIAEVILHVAYYAGSPTGSRASGMAREVYHARGLPLGEIAPSVHEAPPSDMATPEYTDGAYGAVPHLGELRNRVLFGDIWERPELSKRDRSMITVAVLQALYATSSMTGHMRLALDENGVTPAELSELILHGAFYAGWAKATNAGRVAAELFEERGLPLPLSQQD